MSCFPCLYPLRHYKTVKSIRFSCGDLSNSVSDSSENDNGNAAVNEDNFDPKIVCFSFLELATATKNFSPTNLIGQGGFGKVYKGHLRTGQIVAVKKLDHDAVQGSGEFLTELLYLGFLDNSNLVNLIGYCTDGDQRGLVYEYMPMGSLDDHLFHVYSFGVVLLELMIGRRSNKHDRENLKHSYFMDQKLMQLVDPSLQGRYSKSCLQEAVRIATMCLQDKPKVRPLISDVLLSLETLASRSKKHTGHTGENGTTNF
ncbi:Receptor-like kinase lip1 [Thalictrum thalictroides]|uniref:Receptor-like kinase lip1 n=1 Tax=Thalictrum thalictroides TaxID=46969 RepID=A0A7J6VMR5_THATH|nr:Receptor-like kinase lip1 [Thalictrum thalictroides]